jgi:VanZ family protein
LGRGKFDPDLALSRSAASSRLISRRQTVFRAWIPAILWLVIIVIESSALLAAQNTSRILYPMLHFLFGVDRFHFAHWHFYIRKTGHVVGYCILSILLFRAWRATLPVAGKLNPNWTMRWANIAVLGTALVASLDEWHQSFIPSRTGTVYDVILDTCAGVAAQIVVFFWLRSF